MSKRIADTPIHCRLTRLKVIPQMMEAITGSATYQYCTDSTNRVVKMIGSIVSGSEAHPFMLKTAANPHARSGSIAAASARMPAIYVVGKIVCCWGDARGD